jgi:DNA-binding NarL/FixJ family response regulator
MINVILADQLRIFRIGMAGALAAEDDIRIVGQPNSLEQLLHGLEKFRARVLVLSVAYLDHLDEIKQVAARNQTAILLLADGGDVISPQLLSEEVQGIMHRSADESTSVQCVRQLARGERVAHYSRSQADLVGQDSVGSRVGRRLSRTELKIIGCVVQGHKNREIALTMDTTEGAIKNSLRRIYDKTGVFDRLQLALFVLNHRTLAGATRDAHPTLTLKSLPAMQSFPGIGRRPAIN